MLDTQHSPVRNEIVWLRNHTHSLGDSNRAERGRERDKKKGRRGELFEVDKDSFILCTQLPAISMILNLWL